MSVVSEACPFVEMEKAKTEKIKTVLILFLCNIGFWPFICKLCRKALALTFGYAALLFSFKNN
jgi:hypothetical protein